MMQGPPLERSKAWCPHASDVYLIRVVMVLQVVPANKPVEQCDDAVTHDFFMKWIHPQEKPRHRDSFNMIVAIDVEE